MTALRQDVMDYIADIPESKLAALKPMLTLLADDTIVVETDLTDDESITVNFIRPNNLGSCCFKAKTNAAYVCEHTLHLPRLISPSDNRILRGCSHR